MIVPAVVVVVFLLLLYRPGRYKPSNIAYDRQVSTYLTHELLPQLYNGAQLGEPFDLVVTQKGINDIIAHSRWPIESGAVRFSAPMVLLVPGSIILMGTIAVSAAEFIVTVELTPTFDLNGLLSLRAAEVKIGAVNVTLPARMLIRRMYREQLVTGGADIDNLEAQITASLLNNEPFEPVFRIEDKRLRIEKIAIAQEKLTIHLIPVFD